MRSLVNRKERVIAFLLLMTIISGLLVGCSSARASAKVNQKLDLAIKYLSENKYEEAILAYQEIIQIDKKEVKAYQGLGKIYTLQKQYDKAQVIYEEGRQAVSDNHVTQLNLSLAGMYIDKNDLAVAEKAYQEIIDRDKTVIEAYQGLALVYQQQGSPEQALSILQRAAEANNHDSRIYVSLAENYIGIGRYDQATEAIVRSLSLNWNQSDAYGLLNSLYTADWQSLQAEAAKQTDPRISAALRFYGYYGDRDYQNALNIYDKELSTQSDNQKAEVLAAICLIETGNQKQASEFIQEVTTNPANEWIMNDLARYYLRIGDKAKAIEWAGKSFAFNGGNVEAVKLLDQSSADKNVIDICLARLMVSSWKALYWLDQELCKNELLVSAGFAKRISLWGINIGDSYDDVLGKLGNPKTHDNDSVTDSENNDKIVGDDLTYELGNIGISKFSNRVIFVALRSPLQATDEGIRIGDSLSRVVEVYGNGFTDAKHSDGSDFKNERRYSFSNGMLAFDYDSDIVKYIRMFRTPFQKQYIP